MKLRNQLLRLALCKVSSDSEGKLPEWVELVPAGNEVNAVDGRKFRNTSPDKIVAAFNKYGLSLPVDYEHATEKKAPVGDEAPAAGWITSLENRAGAIWGKIEWTPRGAASLASKEYRFISPAFLMSKVGEIFELVSAGLTNKPALTQLPQLANVHEGEHMDKQLCEALGLKEDASMEEVLSAIGALKAGKMKSEEEGKAAVASAQQLKAELASAQAPDLTKFIPRADYDAVLARADGAEKTLAAQKAEGLQKDVDAEIDAALKAGKITPATADYHRASCSAEGGLAKFRDFVKVAPVIAPDSNLDDKAKPGSKQPAMDDTLREVARRCGLTDDVVLASMKA
jgi:phage I-like protein